MITVISQQILTSPKKNRSISISPNSISATKNRRKKRHLIYQGCPTFFQGIPLFQRSTPHAELNHGSQICVPAVGARSKGTKDPLAYGDLAKLLACQVGWKLSGEPSNVPTWKWYCMTFVVLKKWSHGYSGNRWINPPRCFSWNGTFLLSLRSWFRKIGFSPVFSEKSSQFFGQV